MKKSFIFIAAAVLGAAACTRENPVTDTVSDGQESKEVEMVEIEFSASFENPQSPDSKAEINLSTGSATWQNSDRIAIHTHNGSLVTLTYEEASGKFKGTIPGDDSIDDNAVAFYPASIAISGDKTHVNLPFSYASSEVAARSFPLRGIVNISGKSIAFKHLGSLLKITSTHMRDEIDRVVINLPLNITGTLPVEGTDAEPSITPASGTSSITIDVSTLARTSGSGEASFIFPILAGDYAGFSVEFRSSTLGYFGEKSTARMQSFDRKKIYNMASFTVPGYYVSQAFNYNDVTYNKANTYALFKADNGDYWYSSKNIPTDTYANSRFYVIVNGAACGDSAPEAESTIIYSASWNNKPNSLLGYEFSVLARKQRNGSTPLNITAQNYAYNTPIDIYFNPDDAKILFVNAGTDINSRTNIYFTTDLGLPENKYYLHMWGAKSGDVTNWNVLPVATKVTVSGIEYYKFSFTKGKVTDDDYKLIFLNNIESLTYRFDFQDDYNRLTVSGGTDDYYVFFTSTSKTGTKTSTDNPTWVYTDPASPVGTSNYKINVAGSDGSKFAWDSGCLVVSNVSINAGDGIILNFNGSGTDLVGMEASGVVVSAGTWYDVVNSASANTFSVGTYGSYDIYFDVFNKKVKVETH